MKIRISLQIIKDLVKNKEINISRHIHAHIGEKLKLNREKK